MSSEIQSAWDKHPDYRIDLQPLGRAAQVWHGDVQLAHSDNALLVSESDHAPVLYFPQADVRTDLLEPSDHHTVCPFKGQADYWHSRTGSPEEDDVVWAYPDPFQQVAGLAEHMAFYDNRLRVVVLDEVAGTVSPKRFPVWGDIGDLLHLLDTQPGEGGMYVAPATGSFGREVVDGSQILAQAVVAAAKASPEKRVSSIHMIFNRVASVHEPIEFMLHSPHDGRTFTTYWVSAQQGERACAPGLVLLDVAKEDFITHQVPMPDVAGPQSAEPVDMGVTGRDLRIVDGAYSPDPDLVGPPEIMAWVRYREVPEPQYLHQALLAQLSGHFCIGAAMRPHAGVGEAQAHRSLSTGNIAITVTFHAPVDVSGWLLYTNTSEHAGLGMSHGVGRVFTQDGRMVASFGVQGMIRPFPKDANAAAHGGDATAM